MPIGWSMCASNYVLYFPVTCNPTRAVALPNIGAPLHTGECIHPWLEVAPAVARKSVYRKVLGLECIFILSGLSHVIPEATMV